VSGAGHRVCLFHAVCLPYTRALATYIRFSESATIPYLQGSCGPPGLRVVRIVRPLHVSVVLSLLVALVVALNHEVPVKVVAQHEVSCLPRDEELGERGVPRCVLGRVGLDVLVL
jgi:hypothetical protein